MIRCGTPYPRDMEPNNTLSDLNLYEEARQESDEAFKIIQEAVGLKDFKWDNPLPTDYRVEGAEVQRRLRNQLC